ncbi:HtaA domain-containing protein [Streptomyces sp. NPDC091212]|uniref:HtaA domain-containing protein n=1 Tax=Streptomyces sp. NPDC091212 TaxID=3155191 RepID=UPI00343B03E1
MAATRRPITLAAAIATAATLGATAFTLPALAAGTTRAAAPAALAAAPAFVPAAAPALELKDSTLEWGLKESFRTYVTGIAAGTIAPTGGAAQAPDNGVFTFPNGTGSYNTGTHALDTAFDGTVRFSSTAHFFDIKVTDLKVVTSGTTGAIQADVTLNGATQEDIDLASIDLTGLRPETGDGSMVYKDIPTKLTADGAKAFNGMYAAGTELDKATLALTYEKTPTPTDPPGSGTPTDPPSSEAPTDSPTDSPTGGTTTPPGTSSPSPTSGTPTPTPTGPTGSVSPSSPAAEDGAIVDGNLDWGLKESFRSYVVGPIAQGKVELGDGATQSGAAYRFPKGTGDFDPDAQTLDAAFGGKVRFVGHETDGEYLLDLNLSGLEVKVKDGKGVLYADISTKDMTTHKVTTSTGVPFATLDIPSGDLTAKDGVLTLDAVPATLTADGAKAFSGMYTGGTALDALTLAVSLDDDATLPTTGGTSGGSTGGSTGGTGTTGGSGTAGGGTVGGTTGSTTGGSLASTGSDLPVGAFLGAAGAIAAAGAAVVLTARRRRPAQAETA